MPTLLLPKATRGTLRAFSLVVGGGVGGLASVALAATRRDPRWLALGPPLSLVVAAPGLSRPFAVRSGYAAWDDASRHVGELTGRMLVHGAFGALLATRQTREPPVLILQSLETSGWRLRASQPAAAYPHQDAAATPGPSRALDRYAATPGRAWARTLRLPMRLLPLVRPHDARHSSPPSDVYSLY